MLYEAWVLALRYRWVLSGWVWCPSRHTGLFEGICRACIVGRTSFRTTCIFAPLTKLANAMSAEVLQLLMMVKFNINQRFSDAQASLAYVLLFFLFK